MCGILLFTQTPKTYSKRVLCHVCRHGENTLGVQSLLFKHSGIHFIPDAKQPLSVSLANPDQCRDLTFYLSCNAKSPYTHTCIPPLLHSLYTVSCFLTFTFHFHFSMFCELRTITSPIHINPPFFLFILYYSKVHI